MRVLALIAVLLAFAMPALPHGGGLDRNGCHTNRKTGDYHCHRGSASAPPPSATNPRSRSLVGPSAGTIRLERTGPPVSERELVASIQLMLASLGYGPVAAEGHVNEQTSTAVRRFQRDQFMAVDGKATGQLLIRLASVIARRLEHCPRIEVPD